MQPVNVPFPLAKEMFQAITDNIYSLECEFGSGRSIEALEELGKMPNWWVSFKDLIAKVEEQ